MDGHNKSFDFFSQSPILSIYIVIAQFSETNSVTTPAVETESENLKLDWAARGALCYGLIHGIPNRTGPEWDDIIKFFDFVSQSPLLAFYIVIEKFIEKNSVTTPAVEKESENL